MRAHPDTRRRVAHRGDAPVTERPSGEGFVMECAAHITRPCSSWDNCYARNDLGANMQEHTRSSAIRATLGHPVIDGDGHIVEMIPVFADFIRDHGRGDIVDRAVIFNMERRSAEQERAMAIALRRAAGLVPATWTIPTDAEYFATVTTPSRYYERLGEAGIDFAVLYPTFGLPLLQIDDPDHRVTVCRLFNEYLAEEYRPFSDRFTVAAAVPMHSPEEGVAGLEHAKGLGAKVALVPSWVRRPRRRRVPRRRARTNPAFGIRLPRMARHLRARQRLRLRPGVGQSDRARDAPGRALPGHGIRRPPVGDQLHIQWRRTLRGGWRCLRQVAVSGRSHPPVPRTCVSRSSKAAWPRASRPMCVWSDSGRREVPLGWTSLTRPTSTRPCWPLSTPSVTHDSRSIRHVRSPPW